MNTRLLVLSMAIKREHVAYDLQQKYDILLALEKGEKAADLSRKYDVKANTVSDWKKNADKIDHIEVIEEFARNESMRRSKLSTIGDFFS